MLDLLWNRIAEGFGHPLGLRALLRKRPDIRISLNPGPPNISAASVVPWHEFGLNSPGEWPARRRGELRGWRVGSGGHYESFTQHQPAFDSLGSTQVRDHWTLDISSLHGFSNSKSDLRVFQSTDEMVIQNSPEMIDEITFDKMAENLAHKEIRIIHSTGTSDYFQVYQWDGRVFLINDGGSHHLAAAKYIAARLPAEYRLNGKLRTTALDQIAIESIMSDFRMFAISDEASIACSVHDCMESFGATWLWLPLPASFKDGKVILLPKGERRSMAVAKALDEAGLEDVGEFLLRLARRQHSFSIQLETESRLCRTGEVVA